MSDVARWLESLGLGQYADAFKENDIAWRLLPELTNDFLKDIGVDSTGHRMRILQAAQAMGTEPAPGDVKSSAPSALVSHAAATGEAERRQLTVMFCDLVGSTELSQRLDPEDLREINRAYQDAAKVAIERYEGYVARYMGDGVLAYFGYPQAHEDDAERAVRAGLGLVETVQTLSRGVGHDKGAELAVRVGLATGPVVVGDLIGEGASQESAVVGETPNVAARVEALADPDSVFLNEATRRLIGGAFELEELGAKSLKGIAEPVRVYRALREAEIDSRFEAARTTILSPLIAREEELRLLLNRWEQARSGEGQVVLISGEPGIGKSRITEALREQLAGERHSRLQYQCSPYHANSAFYPVITQLKRAARFDRDDPPKQMRYKLEALIGATVEDVAAVAPLFAAMLSLPVDAYPPLDLTPQKQKEKTIQAIADQVVALAREQPVLFIFEDAHWADPTTLEALDVILAACRSAPVLIVVTHRPGFDAPWSRHEHLTQVPLNRLSREDAASLIEKLTGGKAVPATVLDEIVAKTDGVPLFVEELTKTVLEAKFLDERDDRYVLDGPIPPLAIPATLRDSLLARLDRLSPIKEVAQTAACIGREFPYDLVMTVSDLSDSELAEALKQLVQAELVFCKGSPPKAIYTFKHALIRDAAYDSLLKQRRRALHLLIGEAIEARYLGRLAEQYAILAHHFEKAESWIKAFDYLCLAAKRATQDYALGESIHLYQQALAIGERPDVELARDRIMAVHKEITNLLFTRGRFKESQRQGARMVEFARHSGDSQSEGMALVNMASASMWAEDFEEALKLGSDATVVGEESGHAAPLAGGTMITGVIYALTGRLDESSAQLQRTIQISRAAKDHTFLAPAICFSAYRENWLGQYDATISLATAGQQIAEEQKQLAWSLRCQWARGAALVGKGAYDEALAVLREGLGIAEKIGDSAYMPRYVNTIGWLYNECHAFERGAEFNRRAVDIDRDNSHATGVERQVFSMLNWADALVALGDLAAARELLDDAHGIVGNPKTHDWMRWRYTTHCFSSMAEYWVTRGEPGKAAQFVERCLEVANAKTSRKYVAIGQRIAGLVAMHRRDEDAAESALRAAERLAMKIGHPNELWKARAALAELYGRKGHERRSSSQWAEAREVLENVRQSLVDVELRAHYARSAEASQVFERAR